MLGTKPDLADGDDNDDMVADISNRKMAKLYMVKSLPAALKPNTMNRYKYLNETILLDYNTKNVVSVRYLMPVEKCK